MTQDDIDARLRRIEQDHAKFAERVDQYSIQFGERFESADQTLAIALKSLDIRLDLLHEFLVELAERQEHLARKDGLASLESRYETGHEQLRERVLVIETAQRTLTQSAARSATRLAITISALAVLVTLFIALAERIF